MTSLPFYVAGRCPIADVCIKGESNMLSVTLVWDCYMHYNDPGMSLLYALQ